MRRAWLMGLMAVSASAFAEDRPQPLAPLPPEPRSLQVDGGAPVRAAPVARPIDIKQIGEDLQSLKKAVAHVREELLKANEEVRKSAGEITAPEEHTAETKERKTSGPPHLSKSMTLLAQRYSDDSWTVTASIKNERISSIYAELAKLLDRGIDATRMNAHSPNALVSFEVSDLLWEVALD